MIEERSFSPCDITCRWDQTTLSNIECQSTLNIVILKLGVFLNLRPILQHFFHISYFLTNYRYKEFCYMHMSIVVRYIYTSTVLYKSSGALLGLQNFWINYSSFFSSWNGEWGTEEGRQWSTKNICQILIWRSVGWDIWFWILTNQESPWLDQSGASMSWPIGKLNSDHIHPLLLSSQKKNIMLLSTLCFIGPHPIIRTVTLQMTNKHTDYLPTNHSVNTKFQSPWLRELKNELWQKDMVTREHSH